MTLKEFSKKYGMPYTFVIEASIHIFPNPTPERDCDYDEREVYDACKEKAKEKLAAAREKVTGYSRMLDRLNRHGRYNRQNEST